MDPDMNLFSEDSYETILALLDADEDCQIDGLQILSQTLVFGSSDVMHGFPLPRCTRSLLGILETSTNNEIIELSAQCVYYLTQALGYQAASILQSNDGYKVIAGKLINISNMRASELCIQSITEICQFLPETLGKQIGLAPFVQNLQHFSTNFQGQLLESLNIVANTSASSYFSKDLPLLLIFLENPNEKIRSLSTKAFSNIVSHIDTSSVPPGLITRIVGLINQTTDEKLLHLLTQAVKSMVQSKETLLEFYQSHFDFDRIFFSIHIQSPVKRNGIDITVMNILLNVIDNVELPDEYWSLNQVVLPEGNAYLKSLAPFVIKLIETRSAKPDLNLSVLTVLIPLLDHFEISQSLLEYIYGAAASYRFSPFVLIFLRKVEDPSPAISAGILPLLHEYNPPDSLKEWYPKTLAEFEAKTKTIKLTRTPFITPSILSSLNSLSDLVSLLNGPPIPIIEFHSSGLIEVIQRILNQTFFSQSSATGQNDQQNLKGDSSTLRILSNISVVKALQKIADLSKEALMLVPLPFTRDPFSSVPVSELPSKNLAIDVKVGSETITDVKLSLDLDFTSLEAWRNMRTEALSREAVQTALASSELKDLLLVENPHDLSVYQTVHIARAINMQYPRFYFVINGHRFNAYQSAFASIVRSVDPPSAILQPRPVVEFIQLSENEDDVPTEPITIPSAIGHQIKKVLDLLYTLLKISKLSGPAVGHKTHDISEKPAEKEVTSLNLNLAEYSRKVIPYFLSQAVTIPFANAASRIVYYYPQLFPFDVRLCLFKVAFLDMSESCPHLARIFNLQREAQRDYPKIKIHIRRDHLFEDGCFALTKIGRGLIRYDVSFAGESGFGYGPTKEFLTHFGKELSKNSRNLWRTDNIRDEFAFSKSANGLFPRPDADPAIFRVIGTLVAKALLMDMVLPLPLSPAFFKLVKQSCFDEQIQSGGNTNDQPSNDQVQNGNFSFDELRMEDVDKQIAQSLKCKEGLFGLNFTYPGNEKLELKQNGTNIDVTPENVDEYVKLVIEHTLRLKEIVKAFREGFKDVIDLQSLNLFSSQELSNMVVGSTVDFTMDELRQNIEISHGFSQDSPHINFFFETLMEMTKEEKGLFLKFITGASSLPIGGLAALEPKITLAHKLPENNEKPDDVLPSVMTCTNYLKLPEYSSKEVLKQKLLLAITEGQDIFLLS